MNKRVLSISVIFNTWSFVVFSQENKFYGQLETGYMNGIGRIDYGGQASFTNQGEAYRFRVSLGYFFHETTSVGIGIGLDGYHNPAHNTLPVYIDLKKFWLNNSLFGFMIFGYSLKLSPTFDNGLLTGFGLGYKYQRKKTAFMPSIGLNFQQLDGRVILIDPVTSKINFIESEIHFNSVSFNLALQF